MVSGKVDNERIKDLPYKKTIGCQWFMGRKVDIIYSNDWKRRIHLVLKWKVF